LSGIVIKLAREKGEQAKEERVSVSGVVTSENKSVSGGRIGGWQKRRELDRVNVAVHRGRTVTRDGYEFAWSPVRGDGSYHLENLKPGAWYFTFEQPGEAPTLVGPIELKKGERSRSLDIAAVSGGTVEGRAENVPPSMSGMVWVVAFGDSVLRREARVATDGTFRLERLPPGRYGLKVGHDAYEDPHITKGRSQPEEFKKKAEPWQGAVVVTVKPGETARGVVLDFRPPGPLQEPRPEEKPVRL
jgi:hypothetical protein